MQELFAEGIWRREIGSIALVPDKSPHQKFLQHAISSVLTLRGTTSACNAVREAIYIIERHVGYALQRAACSIVAPASSPEAS